MRAVQTHPQEALWFVKIVTLFGSLASLVVSIPCSIFLWMHWTPCGFCNRPLKYWLLVHCMMQLAQAPVRMRFFLRLCQVQHDGNLYALFDQMTSSSVWKNSKMVSVASYGWFVLGVVWLLNSTHCRECPGIYRLCLAVIFLAVARLLLTLIVFYHTFKNAPEDADAPPKPQGASQEIIDCIPCEEFNPDSQEGSCDSCAVCLNDFEEGDMLRRLPCNHSFHTACVDKWLTRNKVCPLCVQDVEVLTKQQADKKKASSSGVSSCCQRTGAAGQRCNSIFGFGGN